MTSESTSLPPRGICVIMAGGRGTRFWPLSRTDRPKQLLSLVGDRSLLRDTYERVAPVVGAERILVIVSGNLADATRAALPELPADHVIVEPVGRNTAPCAILGMGLAARIDAAAPVALLPADHFIPDGAVFRRQLDQAFTAAEADETVITLGVVPTRPETGYGYIETSGQPAPGGLSRGAGFAEKPALEVAEGYVAGGRHFWNSGIFVWNPGWFATMATRHLPAVVDLMAPAVASFGTRGFPAALEEAYRDCPADSIDFAVMEKLTDFGVMAAEFRWSDLGSWDAWGELAAALPGDNRGRGNLMAVDSRDNILMTGDKTVALLGVSDLVVVDTPDALLVCRKDQAQRIKEIIALLEDAGRQDLL